MKNQYYNILRVLVSFALIAVLIKVIKLESLLKAFSMVNLKVITCSLLIYGISEITLAIRWKNILHSNGINISFPKILCINLIGTFTSNFIPGAAGGDVIRPVYLFQRFSDRKMFLYASVFFERVSGVIVIVLLAFLGSVWVGIFQKDWWFILVSLIILIGIIIAFTVIKWFSLSQKQLSGFIGKIQKIGQQFAIQFIGIAQNRILLLKTIIWSLIAQMATITMYWFLLLSLGERTNLLLVIMSISLAWLFAMVPLSFNGMGLRESSVVFILSKFGLASNTIMAVTILGLIPIFIFSIIGAILSTQKIKI